MVMSTCWDRLAPASSGHANTRSKPQSRLVSEPAWERRDAAQSRPAGDSPATDHLLACGCPVQLRAVRKGLVMLKTFRLCKPLLHMIRLKNFTTLWICLAVWLWGQGSVGAQDVQFNRDVRPILATSCFVCHGFDAKTRKADLRLDIPEGAFAERAGVRAITPGDLSRSELWRRITSDDPDEVMPPPTFRHQLTAEQKEVLRRWIEQGAPYQKHWAFEPPQPVPVPNVRNQGWVRNPVDAFILARLEQEGLTPQPEADRPTLIRRLSFALTGLPPTIEDVERFLADTSAEAYERLVQRYLDSPHYGEEMARHWLDVARYADTHGLHLDNEREMWAYRDWVVRAFNRNLPFDQFTIEQLAGDLLPNPTPDQLVATGFNRCNVTTSEGGSIDAEFLFRYAVERTTTTVQTWLGLTAGCAVCHEHKYDPLSMREFYSLYAFFYSAADPAMDRNIRNTDPFYLLPTPEQQAERERLQAQVQTARRIWQDWLSAAPADANTFSAALQPVTDVWLDDAFPPGIKATSTSRNASTWSALIDEMPPPCGLRALTQASSAVYQDRFEAGPLPFLIPEQGRLQVWVHPDRLDPPQALAIVLTTRGSGARRIDWGDSLKLDAGLKIYGGSSTTDRPRVGEVPPPGRWTHLEVPLEKLKLPAGEVVTSVSLVQYGGRVAWDGLQVTGYRRPLDDPYLHFAQWLNFRKGQDTPGLPDDLKTALKNGLAHPHTTPEQIDRLYQFWMTSVARGNGRTAQRLRAALHQAEVAVQILEDSIPGTFIFRDLPQPRDAFVMLRGQYDKPGEKVEPNVPAVLPPLRVPEGRRPNRLDLARWLLTLEQPLTARVTVNRFWQQFFGTGLVKTSYDFGTQGELPSHPELLDWLAVWYRDCGWNTKELVRLLVTSATFRQSSVVSPELLARDPENRLYARGPRFRLDAEQIRDNALFVSGLIHLKMGGPGVKPYQPPNIWEPVGYSDSNTRHYLQDHGSALYRRSIYCFLKRTAPPPFMSNFDGPNREQFCTRRERSNTPLQALQLLNDVQHFEAARAFAERMLTQGGSTPESRITFAFRCALARSPEPEELHTVRSALEDFLTRYRQSAAAARDVIRVGESPIRCDAEPEELAAYTLVANLILNLDETLTRN